MSDYDREWWERVFAHDKSGFWRRASEIGSAAAEAEFFGPALATGTARRPATLTPPVASDEIGPIDPDIDPETRTLLTPSLRRRLRKSGLSDHDFARSRPPAPPNPATKAESGPQLLSAGLLRKALAFGLTPADFDRYASADEKAAPSAAQGGMTKRHRRMIEAMGLSVEEYEHLSAKAREQG